MPNCVPKRWRRVGIFKRNEKEAKYDYTSCFQRITIDGSGWPVHKSIIHWLLFRSCSAGKIQQFSTVCVIAVWPNSRVQGKFLLFYVCLLQVCRMCRQFFEWLPNSTLDLWTRVTPFCTPHFTSAIQNNSQSTSPARQVQKLKNKWYCFCFTATIKYCRIPLFNEGIIFVHFHESVKG